MAKRFRPVPADSTVTSGYGPRWGTVHYGTDFGRAGGSANMPVYAAQGGTVVYAGAASGFGGPDPAGWVVVDHPTADGAGTTVYGHVIREVNVGDRVEAGQRIARVNPNQGTNGNVAPHLHFEVHPTVWRAGTQRDPLTWLGDAPSPGAGIAPASASTGAPDGVIFGVDVSEWQDGMSLRRAADEGIKFAIIRTNDGTHRDRVYRSHLDDAEGAGLVTAAYMYLRNPNEGTTIAQQVDATLAVMGDARRPLWLDCETPAGLHVSHIREAQARFEAVGIRVIGAYSYVPYWERQIAPSEPDSHEFGKFWVAAYGLNSAGTPAALYAAANKRQWSYPLGNQPPVIWQFGSKGAVAGWHVDINAFRGTVDDVRALFYGEQAVAEPVPKPGDVADQITLPPTETRRPVQVPGVLYDDVVTGEQPAREVETEPVDVEVEHGPKVVDNLIAKIVEGVVDAIVTLFLGKKGK